MTLTGKSMDEQKCDYFVKQHISFHLAAQAFRMVLGPVPVMPMTNECHNTESVMETTLASLLVCSSHPLPEHPS